jgi:hypothetical protein
LENNTFAIEFWLPTALTPTELFKHGKEISILWGVENSNIKEELTELLHGSINEQEWLDEDFGLDQLLKWRMLSHLCL